MAAYQLNLLYFLRNSAEFVPLPMRDVVHTLKAETQARYPDRALRLLCSDDPLIAWGDPHLVAHILDNLMSNAIKFSPADRPLELRVFAQGQEIGCAVIDHGPGVDPADRDKLFERYYRGKTSMEGAGLGLALARALAELQGGRIVFETRPGKGSVFTLWLPQSDKGLNDV